MKEPLSSLTTDELIERFAAFKRGELELELNQMLEFEDALCLRQTNSSQAAKIIWLLLSDTFMQKIKEGLSECQFIE